MTSATYFVQGCPTCGRRLQIRVEYLGRKVVCQHCQGNFMAIDPASARPDYVDRGSALLQRANELLDSMAERNTQSSRPPVSH